MPERLLTMLFELEDMNKLLKFNAIDEEELKRTENREAFINSELSTIYINLGGINGR